MERICISLPDEMYNLLFDKAQQKKSTVSHYIRHLMDLGLKVEEMSETNTDRNDGSKKELELIIHLLKKVLNADFETRILVRYLTANLDVGKEEDHEQMREKAKLKAESLVEGLMESL